MNKKIKVAEFVSRLEFGGVEAMVLNYLSHFPNRDKFEFHIITQDINDANCIKQFEKAGFVVHATTHKRKSILKNIIEIFKILRQEKFDVVHSHMTLTNFYVLFLARICDVKLRISHSHSAFREDTFAKKICFAVLKIFNKFFTNKCIACGYTAGEFLYGNRMMKNAVLIMNNAIDLDKFKYRTNIANSIRDKYKLKGKVCVGHIGRFTDTKNHEYLIEVFQEIKKLNKDTVLLLVGDGEKRKYIEELVNSKGLTNSVVFTGNLSDTSDLYQAMDVFVLPSKYEGLPVVAIEAQANGLPCLISSNVDKHCAIASNVHFMSIAEPPKKWAEAILEFSKHTRNTNCTELLTKSGYNISLEAAKLEEIYKHSINM